MEDQSLYSKNPDLGKTPELFRIYYNPNQMTFNIFLWIEQYAMNQAKINQWKIFKALKSKTMNDTLMVCNN